MHASTITASVTPGSCHAENLNCPKNSLARHDRKPLVPSVALPPRLIPPLPGPSDLRGFESEPGLSLINYSYITEYVARKEKQSDRHCLRTRTSLDFRIGFGFGLTSPPSTLHHQTKKVALIRVVILYSPSTTRSHSRLYLSLDIRLSLSKTPHVKRPCASERMPDRAQKKKGAHREAKQKGPQDPHVPPTKENIVSSSVLTSSRYTMPPPRRGRCVCRN